MKHLIPDVKTKTSSITIESGAVAENKIKTIQDHVKFTTPSFNKAPIETSYKLFFCDIQNKDFTPSFIYFDFTSIANNQIATHQGCHGSLPYTATQTDMNYRTFISSVNTLLTKHVKPGTIIVWYHPGGRTLEKTEFYK